MENASEHLISFYLKFYMLVSVIFASSIFFRILGIFNTSILNLIFYDLYSFAMPSLGIFVIVYLAKKNKSQELDKEKNKFIFINLFLTGLIGYCFFILGIVLPFIYVIFPAISIFLLYSFLHKTHIAISFSKKKLAVGLSLILIIPFITVFLGFFSAIMQINTFDEQEKIVSVSNYVRQTTIPFWNLEGFIREYVRLHRASTDFLKFLVVGSGSCGEMAFSTKAIYDGLGVVSHVISFAGEDHMLVEVYYNGNWSVVDPGYGYNLLTRKDRAELRLRDIGGLSYVGKIVNNEMIDVTEDYVQTDEILLKITQNGVPAKNITISLEHLFNGGKISLPEYYTNDEGVAKINLGLMDYNKTSIFPAEPFYAVIIDGKEYSQISSTGSGKSSQIEVELSDLT